MPRGPLILWKLHLLHFMIRSFPLSLYISPFVGLKFLAYGFTALILQSLNILCNIPFGGGMTS